MSVMAQIENQKSKIKNSASLHFVHVPTPGDHYSPATGSAVMTVIHGMTVPHVAAGHAATILVSRGTKENYPPYPAGETREIDLPIALPGKVRKIFDAAWGRLFAARPNAAGQYQAVAAALGDSFDGTLFLHNAPAAIPLLRKRLPHACLALYAHNQLFNTYGAREIRRVIDCADAILCVSHFIANDIAIRAGVKSEKLKTILNGVDTGTFTPNPSPLTSIPSSPTILFLGRVLPNKGPHLLLQAAAKIAASSPFSIRIIGSTNFNANDPLSAYERYLRELAKPISDRVAFVPFIPRSQIVAQFHQAHIYVVPSDWDDPCPLTVLEGLACGMPMVVSSRGGIPEEAKDAALYFAPPDVDQFATHLASLINDAALRAELSLRARQRAEQLAWPAVYQTLRTVLA